MPAVPSSPGPSQRSAPATVLRARALPAAGPGTQLLLRGSAVQVRAARPDDLRATARLHVANLAVGLFPHLGHRFVERWHQTHIDSPHGVALVAVEAEQDGENVVGFLIGSTDRVAFRRDQLTRHRRSLVAHGLAALAVRPRALRRFARTRARAYLRGLQRSGRPSSRPLSGSVAELTAIVVEPTGRGSGTGDALCRVFLADCLRAGAVRAELVADAGPAGPSGFYRRTGWWPSGVEHTRDGVAMRRFVQDLRAAETGRPYSR